MDYKAGMFVYALAFLLGVLCVQQLARLPVLSTLFLLIGFAFLCAFSLVVIWKNRSGLSSRHALIVSSTLLLIIGFLYACFHVDQRLSARLSDSLAGKNILVSGRVLSIPAGDAKVQRFEFKVESHRLLNGAVQSQVTDGFPEKIRLSWYYGRKLSAGDKWQLEVRLKPPHGFMNPGGFDYEAWLFQHGVQATGYVRKSSLNKREQASPRSIDFFRQTLSQQIDALASRSPTEGVSLYPLVKALAVGDKSSITAQQWRVLANTGTSHLMAISGLHIGLASLFAYVLIRYLVPVFVMKYVPAQHLALIGGMLSALLYALVAGLSIPTQRAVIMLFVLSVMLLMRRNHRPLDALGFALLMVLLVDPLAVLSAGFWFSFSAVAVIFISISRAQKSMDFDATLWGRVKATLKQWLRLQLLISLFLLPLSLFMFQQASLVSPLANLLLIPYVSFLVVPLVLLAIIFSLFWLPLSDLFFMLAAALLDFIWPLLASLSSLPFALWVRGDVGIFKLLAATAAMLLIFYAGQISTALFKRPDKPQPAYASGVFRLLVCLLACLLFVPLMIAPPKLASGDFQLTMLDVGQGSAAVVQTRNHVMVFDAGAKFSDRLNAGSGVVIPYLRFQGIENLDRLVISHGDADHIGGAQAIIDEYPAVLVIGRDIENLAAGKKQLCTAGFSWRWDAVSFAFLSPENTNLPPAGKGKRNNHSCVLQVSSKAGRVLFTGDIEKDVELQLVENYGKQLASDILLVPHHGSKTSSSEVFLRAVNQKISLVSVGYKNRYRLPANRVKARYEALSREFLQTSNSGAITIRLMAGSDFVVEKYRETAGKYWHHVVK